MGRVLEVLGGRGRQPERASSRSRCHQGRPLELGAAFAGLDPASLVMSEGLRPPEELERLLAPYLGDDPVFGFMCPWELEQFFEPGLVETSFVGSTRSRRVLSSCSAPGRAPSPRGRRPRLRRPDPLGVQPPEKGLTGSLGTIAAPRRSPYKRGYCVDWRAADRRRLALLEQDRLLTWTRTSPTIRMVSGDDYPESARAHDKATVPSRPLLRPGALGGE